MKKKKIIIGIVCAVVIWAVIGVVDFAMVHSYHKPVFCVGTELADDGGSGKYVGLGYSFDIEGNFMPEAENPGVTSYRGYILGFEVSRGFWEEMLPGSDIEPTKQLTLDEVVELSAKGEELTWSDFEQYAYEDIGSGLYIYRYDIDSDYELRIGGSPSVEPMYIRLVSKENQDDYIDIRTENVKAFIEPTE